MKILIATGIYPPEIGGPATYAALLAQELPKWGFEVKVLPFSTVRQYPKVIRHIVYFFKVLDEAREADIIFTQDAVSTGLPVVCAAFLANKKVVMRIAGDYAWEQASQRFGVKDNIDEFQNKKYSIGDGFNMVMVEVLRAVQRFSVGQANVVITPSKYFSNLVSGWLGGKKEIKTIYNGIDLNFEYKKAEKFNDKTIITAGRLVPWKGFDTLIGTLPQMSEWRLLIAGDGPDKDRLVNLAAELKVSDRVEFLGQLPREELFTKIYQSHVFALLATFESFSFQTVEAMHIGTPAIVGDIGNLSEIIDNGKNGILIDPKDGKSFIEYANRIVADAEFAKKLSENGKSRANDFSVNKTLDQLCEVFKKISGSNS